MTQFTDAVAEVDRIRSHEVPPGSRWVHTNGKLYTAKAVVLLEADLTVMIQYSVGGWDDVSWIRPASEFLDGRFTAVEAKDYLNPSYPNKGH